MITNVQRELANLPTPSKWTPTMCQRCPVMIEEDDDRVHEEHGWSHLRCLHLPRTDVLRMLEQAARFGF